jgi:hypothetical protein
MTLDEFTQLVKRNADEFREEQLKKIELAKTNPDEYDLDSFADDRTEREWWLLWALRYNLP